MGTRDFGYGYTFFYDVAKQQRSREPNSNFLFPVRVEWIRRSQRDQMSRRDCEGGREAGRQGACEHAPWPAVRGRRGLPVSLWPL